MKCDSVHEVVHLMRVVQEAARSTNMVGEVMKST